MSVCVPVPAKEKDGQPSIVTIHFPFDIPFKDFLSRIIAKMDLNSKTAELGWKSCNNSQWTPLWQLTEELYMSSKRWLAWRSITVWSQFIWKLSAWWGSSILVSEHSLTAWQKKPQAAAAFKPPLSTEVTYTMELALVWEKLKCATHPGMNWWCFVKSDGKHEELALEDIILWVRKIVSYLFSILLAPNCPLNFL